MLASLPRTDARRQSRYDSHVARGPYVYSVQYVLPGRASHTTSFRSETPLETGQWLTVDGVYLVVERIVTSKRGDPYDAVALCKLAVG